VQRLNTLIFLGLIAASFAKSQSIESLSAKFSCTEIKKQAKILIEGAITFCSPNTALIITSFPYHQHMFIDGNVLLIHQDSSETASQITAAVPHAIPYLSEFILAAREDFGLSSLGYKVIDVQQNGDTLVSSWTNDNQKDKFYRITARDEKIIKIEISEDVAYQSAKRIEFSNYKNINGVNIPMQSKQIAGDKVTITTLLDSITINNPDLTTIEFELPPQVKIKKHQW